MTIGKKMSEKEAIKETFYLSHGNPILAVDEKVVARKFFEKWTEKVYPKQKQPKAILIVSAHWETQVPSVSSVVDHSDLIYDIADVPPCTFQIKYPSVGSPELAKRVEELLNEAGYKCEVDTKRGLDHASWVPLMLMYPEANIPVCQLSVQSHLDGTHHFNVGRALAPLKDDGYLIIGSGGAVHPSDDTPHFHDGVAPWASEFDSWLEDALTNGRYEDVNNYKTKAPHWELAHPWPEHFYPLIVAMGASGENSKAELIHRSWDHGTLGYASYKFTSP